MLAATELPGEISAGQYDTVYNLLSLAIASLLFTALFLILQRGRVTQRYRSALLVSATVCAIATYHYFRIFENFKESYPAGATIDAAHVLSNIEFNEGYRYVDWFLTVPLLLVETIAVLALARSQARGLLLKLVPASAAMIALGYPGEISADTGTRLLWGTLSTIPFLYILYVLFVELSKSIDRQPAQVKHQISMLRIALVGLWGVYPIAYLFPVFGFDGSTAWVLKQGGYTIADILAKAAFGLAIYRIAVYKSELEDDAYVLDHDADSEHGTEHRTNPRATSREAT